MITERTLKKWRKESLKVKDAVDKDIDFPVQTNRQSLVEWHTRILRMTQEMLDMHLLRKK